MTRCKVCQDARRPEVDQLLAAGRSSRSVAIEFGLPVESMKRHARAHVTDEHAEVPAPPPPSLGDPLAELLGSLRQPALAGKDASLAREYRLALALQQARHAERPTYDVLTDPEWIRLRSLILEALRPFPAALAALREALQGALE